MSKQHGPTLCLFCPNQLMTRMRSKEAVQVLPSRVEDSDEGSRATRWCGALFRNNAAELVRPLFEM